MFSASGAERARECPASAVLPQVRSSSSYTDRGHGIHGFIRRVLVGMPKSQALAPVEDEWRGTCERIDFTRLGADLSGVRCEVAYAIDPTTRTARELGVNIGRRYADHGLQAHEIPGSNDIEGVRFDGVPVIIDIKTGFERVAPCAENTQMMSYALAKQWVTGASEVEGRIEYVRPDGRVFLDSHTFTRFELDAFADELEETLVRVEGARRVYLAQGSVTVSQGDHCRYCDALHFCPAYTALARTMATDIATMAGQVEALTDEQAGVAWTKAKSIETLLETVLDALKMRAVRGPIPLPNGKLAKAIMSTRTSFVQSAALDLLRAKGTTEEEIAGLYRESTSESVRTVNAPGAKKKRSKAA